MVIDWAGESLELVDELVFKQAFIALGGNRTEVARALKVSVRTVRDRVNKYQLYKFDTPEWKARWSGWGGKIQQGKERAAEEDIGGEP